MIARRRFVAVKTKEVMRGMQDEEYQELHEVIENMKERQEKLSLLMERKQNWMGEGSELRETYANKLGS